MGIEEFAAALGTTTDPDRVTAYARVADARADELTAYREEQRKKVAAEMEAQRECERQERQRREDEEAARIAEIRARAAEEAEKKRKVEEEFFALAEAGDLDALIRWSEAKPLDFGRR